MASIGPPSSWKHLWSLTRNPDAVCRRLSQFDQANLRLSAGLVDVVLIAEPSAIVEVLRDTATYSHDTWDYRLLRPLIGQGLLTATGDAWRSRRALVAPVLMSQAPRLLIASCHQAANRLRERLQQASSAGTPIDLHQLLLEFTLSAVSRMLLGRDLTEPDDEIGRALLQARKQVAGWRVLRLSIPFAARAAQRALQRLKSLLVSEVRARRAHSREDLLQRLVDLWPVSPQADWELCDEALTILFTSQISPAALATWGCWLLERQPDIRRRVAAEWHAVCPDRSLNLDDLQRLPLTTAIYQETLRLFPAVWAIPRVAAARVELSGARIARGSQILVLPYAVQRNQRWWPQPEEFLPERFLQSPSPLEGTYIPFGLGTRACVGGTATKLLVLSAWSAIFSEYHFESDPARPVIPSFAMTLQPRDGYWAHLHSNGHKEIASASIAEIAGVQTQNPKYEIRKNS